MEALPGSDGRGDVRILAGDFNSTWTTRSSAGSSTAAIWTRPTRSAKGLTSTWPAPPRATRSPLTIDHVLVDGRVRVDRVTVVGIPRSDHRAVIALLRIPRLMAQQTRQFWPSGP